MKHLDNIEIKNFKSIRHQKIEGCKRVNVFIGYPNVGKSNILEAIGLLTFIRQKRPVGLKGLVRFEKLTQIFNYSNIQNPAIITFNENYSLSISYEDEEGLKLNLVDKNEIISAYDPGFFGLKVLRERLGTVISTSGIDDFSGKFIQLKDFNVKPYRFTESKVFNQNLSALELNIPFGKNMFEVIINNEKIRNEFSELLEPYGLQLILNISESDIKISPKIKDGIIYPIPISLMADTLIRLIFFTTAMLSNKASILVFEEPEAHMFPPYIAKFTTEIIFDKNDNQYFIATHSPFVLNDFMEDMERDDLSIYVVGLKDGETMINRLTDDEITEVYQYGVDLFFNLESYLKDGTVNNA